MGTESGFVRHERASNSLDFPSGTSDEQKSSSWLCLFITYILYNPATEARTWLTHLFLLWHFPADWPWFLEVPICQFTILLYYSTI